MASDVEVCAAFFEEIEGVEVLGAVGEAFGVVFGLGEFWCGVVGGESLEDIVGGAEVVVVFVELSDFLVGVGFGEHTVEFVVEAGLAGVLSPGGEFLVGDAEFGGDGLAVAALEVGLVFEAVDEF
jgi:hypothetical protein